MLATKVSELFQWLGGAVPRSVYVVELTAKDWNEKRQVVIDAERFKTVEEYESRFGELMGSGYSWINLSYVGDLDGHAILSVELPATASGAPTPSVNYSGPMQSVRAAGGDASDHVRLRGTLRPRG